MLLEALRLYACGGHPSAITALLLGCDEVFAGRPASIGTGTSGQYDERVLRIRVAALFFRQATNRAAVLQTAADEPASVRIESGVVRQVFQSRNESQFFAVSYEPVSTGEQADNVSTFEAITVFKGGKKTHLWPYSSVETFPPEAMDAFGPAFVPARVADSSVLPRQWDAIALREEAEERVNQCLGIVAPVTRITTIEYPDESRRRMFVVRLEGEAEPVPLNSAGDGMVRIFQIAVALESVRYAAVLLPSLSQHPLPPKIPTSLPAHITDRRNRKRHPLQRPARPVAFCLSNRSTS